jgi:hypothetical protein
MSGQATRLGGRTSAKLVPSIFTGDYVLLIEGLAIVPVMEVDEKATANLSAALSSRTTKTLREGSAIGPANTASPIAIEERQRNNQPSKRHERQCHNER